MIRLGLRLAVTGGREAVVRAVIIAAAVALGVGLLVSTVAGINAVNTQNARYGWLNAQPANAAPTDHFLWWLLREDYYGGHPIGRLDVAAGGADAPALPGIPALPGPGEYYASPAMTALLASTPADQLGDRYRGRAVGTIGPDALPGPDFLLIIVGHRPDELAAQPDVDRVSRIGPVNPGNCLNCVVGTKAAGLVLILSVVAAAMLFPVLIFIGSATRLTAASREQRFAAMRLLGATPRQVSVMSAAESTAAAVIGTALGFGLFLAARPTLASFPFTGVSFYQSDLTLSIGDILLVALGVPAGSAAAALIALRRVRISPLGVTRRVTPPPPRAYRVIPVLAGLAELAYFIGRRPPTTLTQAAAFLSGILIVMAGLVIAGPWFTMVGARLLARRSSRPATLIAARRLADNPAAGFRAVSGLVLALFVTSVAVGVITAIVDERGGQSHGVQATTMSTQFWSDLDVTAVPASLIAELDSTPGVRTVTVVRRRPVDTAGWLPGLVPCADLPAAFGQCDGRGNVATVWDDVLGFDGPPGTSPYWPTISMPVADLARLPVLSITVGTDGSTRAVERTRTLLENAYPQGPIPPHTNADFEADFTKTTTSWRRLADVVILASLPIAGCSLAASVAGGLSERKRPFSLLRLSGAPFGLLRKVVALETAAPMLIVAAIAIGAGFLTAELFLRAQMGYHLRPPGSGYYLIVLGGLVASLGIIASTLPMLRRITGPETARNE